MLEKGTKVKLWPSPKIPMEQRDLIDKVGIVVTSSDRVAVVDLVEPITIKGEVIGNYVVPIDWLERVN